MYSICLLLLYSYSCDTLSARYSVKTPTNTLYLGCSYCTSLFMLNCLICSLTGDSRHSERATNEHTVSGGLGFGSFWLLKTGLGARLYDSAKKVSEQTSATRSPPSESRLLFWEVRQRGTGQFQERPTVVPTENEGAEEPICYLSGPSDAAVVVCRQVRFLGGLD